MNIGIVIVTHDRLNKLKKSLKSIDEQTFPCAFVVVVDNNSKQDTKKYLEKWESINTKYKKIVISLLQNVGGSGGFYYGLKEAQKQEVDWICVFDDDACIQKDVLKIANRIITDLISNDILMICGRVVNSKFDIENEHRRKLIKSFLKIKEEQIIDDYYLLDHFECDFVSFVGTFIRKDALEKVGYPNKDFFIWYDDSEYSLRIRKKSKIICYPQLVFVHYNDYSKNDLTWKSYYGIRNKLYTYKHFFKFQYFIYSIIYFTKSFFGIITRNNIKYNKMIINAIFDATFNKMGISKKYNNDYVFDEK